MCSFCGGVPGLVWPADNSHSPWTSFWGPRQMQVFQAAQNHLFEGAADGGKRQCQQGGAALERAAPMTHGHGALQMLRIERRR